MSGNIFNLSSVTVKIIEDVGKKGVARQPESAFSYLLLQRNIELSVYTFTIAIYVISDI
jgi:hypothetical protein